MIAIKNTDDSSNEPIYLLYDETNPVVIKDIEGNDVNVPKPLGQITLSALQAQIDLLQTELDTINALEAAIVAAPAGTLINYMNTTITPITPIGGGGKLGVN